MNLLRNLQWKFKEGNLLQGQKNSKGLRSTQTLAILTRSKGFEPPTDVVPETTALSN